MGTYEPLKTPYSLEEAVEMWTEESDGCYEEGLGSIGKAGGFLAKSSDSGLNLMVMWWRHPWHASINHIIFWINQKQLARRKDSLVELFNSWLHLSDAFYGYISHDDAIKRQHFAGSIRTRMPGVFWINYFGPELLNMFGRERVEGYDWWKQEDFHRGKLPYLDEYPDRDILSKPVLEQKAQLYLGIAVLRCKLVHLPTSSSPLPRRPGR